MSLFSKLSPGFDKLSLRLYLGFFDYCLPSSQNRFAKWEPYLILVPMLSNSEFNELIEDMSSEDLSLRVATLEVLRDYPSADERVLPYLERLLDDKTPCLVAIPYLFGEVRLLAAHALAAQRAALGINEPVRVQNVVKPINTAGITYAERAANVEFKGGVEGVLENFAILRDMGYLPLIDLDLWPFDRYPHPPTAQAQLFSVNGMQQKSREAELVPA